MLPFADDVTSYSLT